MDAPLYVTKYISDIQHSASGTSKSKGNSTKKQIVAPKVAPIQENDDAGDDAGLPSYDEALNIEASRSVTDRHETSRSVRETEAVVESSSSGNVRISMV